VEGELEGGVEDAGAHHRHKQDNRAPPPIPHEEAASIAPSSGSQDSPPTRLTSARMCVRPGDATGPNLPPAEVTAVIEIPTNERNKYELDKELGVFRLDRVLYSAVHYRGDYGSAAAREAILQSMEAYAKKFGSR
jgi:hypothetical protein